MRSYKWYLTVTNTFEEHNLNPFNIWDRPNRQHWISILIRQTWKAVLCINYGNFEAMRWLENLLPCIFFLSFRLVQTHSRGWTRGCTQYALAFDMSRLCAQKEVKAMSPFIYLCIVSNPHGFMNQKKLKLFMITFSFRNNILFTLRWRWLITWLC